MHVHTDTHMQVSLEARMLSTHPACPVEMPMPHLGPAWLAKKPRVGPAPSSCSVWVPVVPGTWDERYVWDFIGKGSTLDSQQDRAEPRPHPKWALALSQSD